MQFLFQPLTWGFLLIGVPILIHLINMLRHRRQKWAAMDFLLESYRRNRRWVMLKQWLLLASRMLAMFLLVAMLASWVSASKWLGWFGGQTTHHYILIDDSFSMAEVDQEESAYGRSLRALSGLVRTIAGEPGEHQLTLVRLSRAALAAGSNQDQGNEQSSDDQATEVPRIDMAADLIAQSVPRDPARLLDRLSATTTTALQLSPEEALDLITPMVTANANQRAVVYLLTDVRAKEFGEPESLRNRLQALTQADAEIQVIDCAKDTTGNLSLVDVRPEQEVWAAGVPLMVRFQIRNHSSRPVRNLVAEVEAVTYAEGATTPQVSQAFSGEGLDLPPVVIEQLAPGETVTRQVQVVFGVPGQHVIQVSLPDDSLSVDNRRWCVVDIQRAQRVLLVDGDVEQDNAFYFETVVSPDTRLNTGMEIETVDASYLRDVAPETLSGFDVVGLLDIPRLDPQAISKLEGFAAGGGGLLIAAGPNSNLDFINNQLYRGGEGLFPVPLDGIVEIEQSLEASEPQVVAQEHPILAPLRQLSNSPFFQLRIRKMLTTAGESVETDKAEVVAIGPRGRPLLLDSSFGEGRVVSLLTGLDGSWSNWAQDPTFVVLSLRSLGYLGSFNRPAVSEPVGSGITLAVSGESLLPDADVLLPGRKDGLRVRLQQKLDLDPESNSASLDVPIDLSEMNRDLVDGLLRPGVFEVWLATAEGETRVYNFAHNVAAAEGDLQRVSSSELQRKLSPVEVQVRNAESVSGGGLNAREASHSTLLMCLLALLLLAEQALAYSASYHANAKSSSRRGQAGGLRGGRGRSSEMARAVQS